LKCIIDKRLLEIGANEYTYIYHSLGFKKNDARLRKMIQNFDDIDINLEIVTKLYSQISMRETKNEN
jgi:Ca2+-binding EF-hand superfamily protein